MELLENLGGEITDVISQSSELVVSTNGATKILTLNLGGYLSSSHEAGKVGNANVALGAFDINTRTVTLQNNNGVTAVLSVDIGGNLNKGADGVITMPILNAWSPLVLKLTDSGGTIQNLASQNYTEIIKKRPPQTTTNKKEKKNANTHASTDHFVRARWRVCRRQLDIHISMTVPQAAERGASSNIRRLPQNPSITDPGMVSCLPVCPSVRPPTRPPGTPPKAFRSQGNREVFECRMH